MIIIVKKGDGYLIGEHTQLNLETDFHDEDIESNDLLFESYDDPDTIVAIDGSPRIAFFTKYCEGLFPKQGTKLTMKYMCRNFTTKLYNKLVDAHYAEEDIFAEPGCDLVVVRKDKAYMVGPEGEVQEIGECDTTGDLSYIGEGVLKATEGQDPLKRILKAFNYIFENSVYTRKELVVADTSSGHAVITRYNEKDIKEILG